MQATKIPVAVVMQRRATQNRWQSEVWEPHAVLADYAGEAGARLLRDDGSCAQWLHAGLELCLHRDEAEGYYLNVSTETPKIFVMWRMEPDGAQAGAGEHGVPQLVTASYNEAGRLMDGGERVDTVGMPAELLAWVGEYVERNYRPEPKKRRRPQSFVNPAQRGKGS
jgi:hypothetical protein